ncbi:hypothetical protein A3Q35_02945 [Aeribacillus pallidus]|nr:hypothetical protein A3Q35_02945 [Aeribacillus pallidus]
MTNFVDASSTIGNCKFLYFRDIKRRAPQFLMIEKVKEVSSIFGLKSFKNKRSFIQWIASSHSFFVMLQYRRILEKFDKHCKLACDAIGRKALINN